MHNSEELYFATLNSLTAHIAVLDKAGNIIAVNDAWRCFAKANQASKGLIRGVGLNYLQACQTARGPSREGALQCLAGLRAVLNGTLAEFELEYPCHSPTEQRWFFLRAVPLLHKTGGLVISHINITERKCAEQVLQESRERIQLLLNSTAEAIFGLDLEGRCTFCNPPALRFLGYERPAQLLGKIMHNLVHHTRPDGTSYPQEECPIYRAFGHNVEAHGDDELLWRSDGTSFPAEYWSHPIRRAGKVVGAVVTFLDITERKRAIQEIQRIRSYLANIVDSMPSILIGVDLEGNVTEWNQGAERATGITAAAACGHALTQWFPQYGALPEKLNEAIQRQRPIPSERMISTKNGEYMYADIVIYPLQVANEVVGAVVRIDNVTDRVRLEQLLVQSEKMLSIGGLAAGMAHELNNPLGVILQGSQTILRRLTAELPANQQVVATLGITLEQVSSYLAQRRIIGFLNDIREAARRAARIVADMLAFSERAIPVSHQHA